MSDSVEHPSHYGGEDNPYEIIKIIEALNLDFHLGNVLKYIGRPTKGKYLEDLKKARWYLDRKIAKLEEVHKNEPAAVKLGKAGSYELPTSPPSAHPCIGCVGLSANHRPDCKYKDS